MENFEKYLEGDAIIKKVGKKPGKTLAIFAGTHGNEKAGVVALADMLDTIEIDNGTVYFVFTNPEAIKKDVRQIEVNINRCYTKDNNGDTVEARRALKLMEILDECDAFVDLHSSNTPGSKPFAICEEDMFPFVAPYVDVEIVSTGWDAIEAGASDGYVYQQGKPSLCLECGYAGESSKYVKLAEDSAYKFLQHFGALDEEPKKSNIEKKYIHVDRMIKKPNESFKFVKDFKDFEHLVAGTAYAKDDEKEYIAEENDVIVFPNDNKQVGGEVCILGKVK